MKRKSLKLKRVNPILRRSGERIRAFYYTPHDDVINRLYDYAKRLWNDYRIITTLKTVEVYGKTFIAVRQNRKFVSDELNVKRDQPILTVYVEISSGELYVPSSYFDRYDQFFVYACCYYVAVGLKYKMRSETIGYLDSNSNTDNRNL